VKLKKPDCIMTMHDRQIQIALKLKPETVSKEPCVRNGSLRFPNKTRTQHGSRHGRKLKKARPARAA